MTSQLSSGSYGDGCKCQSLRRHCRCWTGQETGFSLLVTCQQTQNTVVIIKCAVPDFPLLLIVIVVFIISYQLYQDYLSVWFCVHVCVFVRERECVCVCERETDGERARGREREFVCVCERERVCERDGDREHVCARACVCVCVCVWERERERENVCVCERQREREWNSGISGVSCQMCPFFFKHCFGAPTPQDTSILLKIIFYYFIFSFFNWEKV